MFWSAALVITILGAIEKEYERDACARRTWLQNRAVELWQNRIPGPQLVKRQRVTYPRVITCLQCSWKEAIKLCELFKSRENVFYWPEKVVHVGRWMTTCRNTITFFRFSQVVNEIIENFIRITEIAWTFFFRKIMGKKHYGLWIIRVNKRYNKRQRVFNKILVKNIFEFLNKIRELY